MDLRQLQMEELAILKDYANFCDRHGLRYYLAGGTLLGAVRHKGFIPWDDDVDVIMPRPDYERFLALAHKGHLGKYAVVDDYHGAPDAMPYAKLEHPGIRVKSQLMRQEQRLWIDIFPMDGMPAGEWDLACHLLRLAWYSYGQWQAQSARQEIHSPLKRAAKLLLFSHYRKKGGLYYSRKMTACARHYPYEGSEYVGCAVGKYGRRERIRKDVFEERIRLPFEGEQFYVSKGYDTYLRNLYGDYRKLPGKGKKHIRLQSQE